MALLDVRVPQMGEGLQEVVIVGFHKKPGDSVKRDELLYSMETDKAVMDVESPYDGVIKEWLAAEGAVLPIGAPIARLESAFGADEPAVDSAPKPHYAAEAPDIPNNVQRRERSTAPTDTVIPPRTRAMGKQMGISENEMQSIVPASGNKLMPADVEAFAAARGAEPIENSPSPNLSHLPRPASSYLGGRGNPGRGTGVPAEADLRAVEIGQIGPSGPIGQIADTGIATNTNTLANHAFTETPLSQQQRVFTSRIRRSAALVIPATMTRPIEWDAICACTRTQREQDFTFRPTEFQTFAWCVAQASREHPKLRSTLQGDETVREYAHINLGIAVGLKNGELVTAVVRDADTLDYHDFVSEIQTAIGLARDGKDQADAGTQLHLTYMGPYGITEATPLLVAPAIAVMFVGASYPRDGKSWVNMSLTIDHRLINGVEGAKFLMSVVEIIEKLDEIT